MFHGAHRVEGGARDEARSILTTKREIKELRERADDRRTRRSSGCCEEATGLDVTIAAAESAIASLQAELHRQEKAVVGYDLQVDHGGRRGGPRVAEAGTDHARAAQRGRELRAQERRGRTRRGSRSQRIETEQRAADEQLIGGAAAAVRGARDDAGATSRA